MSNPIPIPFFNIGGIDTCLKHPSCTPNIWDECIKYIRNCRDKIDVLVLTTGIHKLMRKEGNIDYPKHYIERYKSLIRQLNNYARKFDFQLIFTIPDIPTNYKGKPAFWSWNVTRTIEYIQEFLEYSKLVEPAVPMPMIPGIPDDIKSVLQVYHQHEDLYNKFDIIGIGQVVSNKRDIQKQVELILSLDKLGKKLYLFGYPVKAIREALKFNAKNIYGFQTTTFFWKKGGMVSGRVERTEALEKFIGKIHRQLGINKRYKRLEDWL